jgi:23S rRNA (cytidine1920-2'-O)/16S rRNA (cytidine1409-2'-O)-methyltransferase
MARKTFREFVEELKAAPRSLRGSAKLVAALDHFDVGASGRVCLDIGASSGGFTTMLLERGATRVYAVDAGHGQLLGSLRQDPRVVNLEGTNVGDLSSDHVPDVIDVVTIDVSYLSLASAVAQLDRLRFAAGAEIIGLVKPMFELRLATAPTDTRSLDEALDAAVAGIATAGWHVAGTMESPERGAKGAIEGFVHARTVAPDR